MLNSLPLVALGGAVGASLRFLLGIAVARVAGPTSLPVELVVVNILGSALLGLFAGFAEHRGAAHLTPFVTIGVLGGFTTFSGFCMDAAILYHRGEPGLAAAYVAISVSGSLGGLALGLTAAKTLFS